jgi:hypothetical protein
MQNCLQCGFTDEESNSYDDSLTAVSKFYIQPTKGTKYNSRRF